MIKLIALDMDGTLLNSKRQISEGTKHAIQRAKQQGINVVLASGRPIDGMRAQLKELELVSDSDYVLHFNGSVVQKVASGEVIHQAILTGKDAKRIAQVAAELGVNTHAFSQQLGLITPKTSRYTEVEAEINGIDITEVDFSTLEDDHPIVKCMIIDAPEKLTQAIAALPSELYEDYTIVQSAAYFLEFLNPSSNKGLGVAKIAEHLGLTSENVMCVGDAENDHHMLRYAGVGVAMANAMEETKQIADFITRSNDEDGVAYVIEKFALS